MIQSTLIDSVPGIRHVFGSFTDPSPDLLTPDFWKKNNPTWKQVHGNRVCAVPSPNYPCGDADGMWTQEPLTPLGVITADCVPILLTHSSGKQIAALHAGWRGSLNKIIGKFAEQHSFTHQEWGSWFAALGPAIGPCCFEVQETLVETFCQTFPHFPRALINPRHRHLDLWEINRLQLNQIGVHQVEILRQCTRCSLDSDTPRFFSHRRCPGEGRQLSMIVADPFLKGNLRKTMVPF